VADAPQAADVTVDGHVVGRVGEDHLRLAPIEQPPVVLGRRRIAAEDPVRAREPEVAAPRHGRFRLVDRWQGVGFIFIGTGLQTFDQKVDLGRVEAGHLDVEVEVQGRQVLQLDRQVSIGVEH
jgi:hypothetical protein